MNLKKVKFLFPIFLVFTLGCDRVINTFKDGRAPNKYEVFYQEMALNFNEPRLCQKISWEARLTAGFSPKGFQISLTRSDCLQNVALRYGLHHLCEDVKPISTLFLDGSKYSKKHCLKELNKYGAITNTSTYSVNPHELISIFKEMGYAPHDISAMGVNKPLVNYFDEYQLLKSKPDIVQRLIKVIENNPGTLEEKRLSLKEIEFMYEMLGLLENDIGWCQRIRPSTFLDGHYPGPETVNTRNHCIYKIAFNTKNLSFCDELSQNQTRPENFDRMKKSCLREADPNFDSYLTYSFIIPADIKNIKRIIKALDYHLQTVEDISREEIGFYYSDFLMHLKPSRSEHYPIYQDMMSRIYALPDFN